MKAVVYSAYSPPSVLQLSNSAKPVPKRHEVLVQVYASTVTAGAIWMRKGASPGSRLLTVALWLVAGICRPLPFAQ